MKDMTNDEGADVEGVINATAALVIRHKADGRAFNLSNLLIQREADLSRVIAWMLDPRGNHGMAHAFLDLFLDMCGIHAEASGLARVRLEVPLRIPGSSRSAFRDNRDQRSEMMAISIPTSSRSVFRHDGDQMRDVLVV